MSALVGEYGGLTRPGLGGAVSVGGVAVGT